MNETTDTTAKLSYISARATPLVIHALAQQVKVPPDGDLSGAQLVDNAVLRCLVTQLAKGEIVTEGDAHGPELAIRAPNGADAACGMAAPPPPI